MKPKLRHPSLERLLEFVGTNHGIKGPSALAQAMHESDQVLTNWGSRGVSKAGAMNAERKFGCSASWILDGKDHTHASFVTASTPENQPNVAVTHVQKAQAATNDVANASNAVDTIAAALALMTDDQRETMAGKLASLARAPDSPTLKKSISQSLESTATNTQKVGNEEMPSFLKR